MLAYDRDLGPMDKAVPMPNIAYSRDAPEDQLKSLLSVANDAVNRFPVLTGDEDIEDTDACHAVIKALESFGWMLEGHGYFSVAFSQGGYVLKVGLRVNDAYPNYAMWCRRHQGLPGVPRMYAMKVESHCYGVLMKKYQSVHSSPLPAIECCGILRDAIEDLPLPSMRQMVDAGVIDTVKTAREIGRYFRDMVSFDTHAGNFLYDPDTRQIIISDPVSFGHCSSAVA